MVMANEGLGGVRQLLNLNVNTRDFFRVEACLAGISRAVSRHLKLVLIRLAGGDNRIVDVDEYEDEESSVEEEPSVEEEESVEEEVLVLRNCSGVVPQVYV